MRRKPMILLTTMFAALLMAGVAEAKRTPPPFVPIEHQTIELPAGFEASTPVWTQDGKHLLFSSGGDLYLIGANGKGLGCISCGMDEKPEIEPAVQEAFKDVFPDGRRILWGDFEHAWVVECAPSVLRCDDAEAVPIDVSTGGGGPPVLGTGVWHLSPDGEYLGWTASRFDVRPMLIGHLRRTADSYVVDDVRAINPPAPTSGTDPNPRRWTNGSALYELKGFSPDGTSVDYVSSRFEGNPDVFSVDLATGKVTRVTAYPDWDEDNGVSPDGRSMVLYSDRGMHRVDAAGLIPRRSFIDYPISANAAIYYVGHDLGFQCDLQPWLLPAYGDMGGKLLGQPVAPYTGGDMHPQNNVPGRGAWNPRSTKVALTEMSYATNRGTNRLLIAKLDRKASDPVEVQSSAPGDWAGPPADYSGLIDTNQTVTLDGLAAGTATVTYSGNLLNGGYAVVYNHYSDDGESFLDGTESIDSTFGIAPSRNLADITISGAHEGSLKADFVMGRSTGNVPNASGTVAAELDGYKLAGSVQKLGACPDKLPKVQPLELRVNPTANGVAVRVVADTAPELWTVGGNRGDRRPVRGAVVKAGGERAVTGRNGKARLALSPGSYRVEVSAGDTFEAASRRIRAGT